MYVDSDSSSARLTQLDDELDVEMKTLSLYFMQQRLYEKLGNLAFVMNDLVKNLRNIRKMEKELEVMRAAAFQKMLEVDDKLNSSIQHENIDANK